MTALDATTASPDVAGLIADFRSQFLPSAEDFLADKITANELREAWRPYYYGAFLPFDRTVERSWRSAADSSGKLEVGPPSADQTHQVPLSIFPVSVAHNNLDRLVEVLAVQIGDQKVTATRIPERIVDFAHFVDALHRLMTSLSSES